MAKVMQQQVTYIPVKLSTFFLLNFSFSPDKISKSVSSVTAMTFLPISANSMPDIIIEIFASPLHCIAEKPSFSNLAQSNLISWSLLFVFPMNASLVKVTVVLSLISKLANVVVVRG